VAVVTYTIRHEPSERLLALLRGAHDDDTAPLSVLWAAPDLVVLRADSSELSTWEDIDVRAILAADSVAPIK
jgi:hypothetical protein